jgi:U2 small nuclear ribonucleoprotein A'
MRITAELLALAEQRTNPLSERELVLQGLGIPAIENMGAARDQFDTWDLSNNRISRLENLPRLSRLSHLLLAGNIIQAVDSNNLSKNVPNIKSVTLSYNHISSLNEVANIGKSFPKIEFLSLVGNPVTSKFQRNVVFLHLYQNTRV